jgi:beta-lactamase class D
MPGMNTKPFVPVFVTLSILVSLLTGCATTPAPAPVPSEEVRPEFQKYFENNRVDGCFVLYDLKQDHYVRTNPDRCATGYLPASTFKILNALIALETGVIDSPDTVMQWDGTRYQIESWNRDQTMRSAIRDSVVWYFQEVARRVGRERMQTWVDKVGYGNRDISGNIDSFWLDGGLRISPDEQVAFLVRLYNNDLPFSQKNMDLVKEMILLEQTDSYRLRVKTGWAVRVEDQIGWWVGWVEKGDDVYFFATNFQSDHPDQNFGPAREGITRSILKDLGILP